MAIPLLIGLKTIGTFALKALVASGTIGIATLGYVKASEEINNILDQNYPDFPFRLTPNLVKWAHGVVEASLISMISENNKKEVLEQQLAAMTLEEIINMMVKSLVGEFINPGDPKSKITEEMAIVLANGIYRSCLPKPS